MFTKNLNPIKFPERKSLRIKNYNYSAEGAYFITVCTKDRKHILSTIQEPEDCCSLPKVNLTEIGTEVEKSILYIDSVYDSVSVDNYVIMPNHIHLIISLSYQNDNERAKSIERIMYQLKSFTTNKYKKGLWQRSYYDHIIRDKEDYNVRFKYIEENPSRWKNDPYFR